MNDELSQSQSVIQHISSEPHPYRVPVFKLEPLDIQYSNQTSKKAKKVRLVSCDFTTNYYNISPNDNCLRWLRKVNLELNEKVIEKYPDNITAKNPYFENMYPPEEWHLCTLYINPGQYQSVNSLIDEINNKFNESFKSLFNFSTVVEKAYSGVQLNYGNYLFNSTGIINIDNGSINTASLSSPDYVSYIVDGDLTYTSNDKLNIVNNAIVRVKNLNNATITESKLLNSKFQQNQLTAYESNNEWYVHNSTLASMNSAGTDNIMREMNILNTETNLDIYTNNDGSSLDEFDITEPKWNPIKYTDSPVLINKTRLKTFPDFIGLTTDDDRRSFHADKYNYRLEDKYGNKLNPDLYFDVDLNINIKNDDSDTYGEIVGGSIRAFSVNCNLVGDRSKTSLIDYSGNILNNSYFSKSEKFPITKIYFNDNSNDNEHLYFNISYNFSSNQDALIEEKYTNSNVIRTKTTSDNIDLYFNTPNSIDAEEFEYSYDIRNGELVYFKINNNNIDSQLIGYKMKKILNSINASESLVSLSSVEINPLESNIRLVVNNAKVGAGIAKAYSEMK